jgi:CRISPR/Cas system-associated endonuclease Cas3-HD
MASKRSRIDLSRDENIVRLFFLFVSRADMNKQGRPRRKCAGKVDLRPVPRYSKGNDSRAERRRLAWEKKKTREFLSRQAKRPDLLPLQYMRVKALIQSKLWKKRDLRELGKRSLQITSST